MPPEISTSWGEFLALYVVLTGGAAFMAGQGLALEWRSRWLAGLACLPIAGAGRFLDFALFNGELWSLLGYGVVLLVCMAMALLAHRMTEVGLMVRQYPWLYERSGLLRWRSKGGPTQA